MKQMPVEMAKELSTKRREVWIARIGRKNWMPSPYSNVCSDHFVTGMFTFSSFCCMQIDFVRCVRNIGDAIIQTALQTIFKRPDLLGMHIFIKLIPMVGSLVTSVGGAGGGGGKFLFGG